MAAHNAQYQGPIKPSHQSFLHIQGLAPFELLLVTWHTLQQSGYRDVWDVSRPKNVFDEGFYNQQWSSTGSDEQHAIIKPRSMWWDSQQIEANVSGRGSTWRVESSCRPQTEHPGVRLLFVRHKHTHTHLSRHTWQQSILRGSFLDELYRIIYQHWQKTKESGRLSSLKNEKSVIIYTLSCQFKPIL